MKKRITILALLTALELCAGSLPWPHASSDTLYLPLGLQWFQDRETANANVVHYGEPDCGEKSCRWMADTTEGTIILELSYHASSLTGIRLDYTVKKELGTNYMTKLEKLKGSVSDWLFIDLREFPDVSQSPHDNYRAETKDSRIVVKWREGEHSLFISIDMSSR